MDWFNKVVNAMIALIIGIAGMIYLPDALDPIVVFINILIYNLTLTDVRLSPEFTVFTVCAGWIVFTTYAIFTESEGDHREIR